MASLIATVLNLGKEVRVSYRGAQSLTETANLWYIDTEASIVKKSYKIPRIRTHAHDLSSGYYALKDASSGKAIHLSSLSNPHIEMCFPNGQKIRSNFLILSKMPTIRARVSRSIQNMVVLEWDIDPALFACIKKLQVFEQRKVSQLFSCDADQYVLVTHGVSEKGSGRFDLIQEDIEIRALTLQRYFVQVALECILSKHLVTTSPPHHHHHHHPPVRSQVVLPDGRSTDFIPLDPAVELLLSATIDPFGKFIHLAFIDENDDDEVGQSLHQIVSIEDSHCLGRFVDYICSVMSLCIAFSVSEQVQPETGDKKG